MGQQRAAVSRLIKCPYCHHELLLPGDAEWTTCTSCQHQLNARAQEAYARAKTAFLSVQDFVLDTTPGKTRDNVYRAKAKLNIPPLAADVIRAYQQAYSGLNIAFQYDLPESQRLSSIEMMAEITRVFAPRAIVSTMEAEYWTKLMIAMTAHDELQSLEERLVRPAHTALPAFLWRWRLRLRQHRLTRALIKLDAKIRELERIIGFLDPPHVR